MHTAKNSVNKSRLDFITSLTDPFGKLSGIPNGAPLSSILLQVGLRLLREFTISFRVLWKVLAPLSCWGNSPRRFLARDLASTALRAEAGHFNTWVLYQGMCIYLMRTRYILGDRCVTWKPFSIEVPDLVGWSSQYLENDARGRSAQNSIQLFEVIG